MKKNLFFSALFRARNIFMFFICMVAIGMFGQSLGLKDISSALGADFSNFVVASSFIVYLILVAQSMMSKDFSEEFVKKQKMTRLRGMNNECISMANSLRKRINNSSFQKLKRVMDDKNEILNSFMKGGDVYLKEKIVEETLKLVYAYIRLMDNYTIRSKELDTVNVNEVTERINTNSRKLNFTNDPYALEDLKKIMEMDGRIIQRLKEERLELERMSSKLDYMESTINMFKHQVMSRIESDEIFEKIDTIVNEAEALDSVLQERRKNRIR